ncbi:hypothetical protein [Halomarina litorea]|uniref:hypothetical protein n=1 Tax=Halomarina litorea TaxID=2961595 RepID=UPI0020C5A1F3|nr:hypothetical protein [Halomarina sp. BCD28]
MDDDIVRGLHVMFLQVLLVDAVIHLTVVVPRLQAVLSSGVFPPRIVTTLMTLSILAIVLGVAAAALGVLPRRPLYLLAAALMVAQILAWLTFHNTGVAGGHTHDTGLLTSVLQHLDADPIEGAAKAVEGIALVLSLLLYRVEGQTRRATSADPTEA